MIGTTLGHYKVTERIGAGGMGVVYKARDLHLDRFVALKILPPEKVVDPERKRRFVQEAKAASALNHPNIVTIHDITQEGGTDFIVMEYVEGKTLDQRIGHRGLRLSDALRCAVQITDALAKAHSAGIVHRDLKPTNIMVNEDGVVKILDFGLAKLTEQVQGDETASTATVDGEGRPITEEGVIVGTVAYMSPEQAEGKKVDARSDIFSLGSVLYEMATGQKAFQGASKMSTLSAILHQEPKPVGTITPAIPPDLEKLISRCLRKDPLRRWQNMSDLKVALDELKEDSDSGRLQAAPAAAKRVWPMRLAVIVVAVAVLVAAGWYWIRRQRVARPEATLAAVPLTSYPGREDNPSFSNDGNSIAFDWCPEGPDRNCDIYVKQIGFEPPQRLTTDPADDFGPAWSPDGQSIAFLRRDAATGATVMLIPSRGGRERPLEKWNVSKRLALFPGPYLAWTPDSKALVICSSESGRPDAGLFLLSVATDERRRLTDNDGDAGPAFSPDGRTLAFQRRKRNGSDLYLLRLGEGCVPQGTPELVASGDPACAGATWMSDGSEIIFASGSYSRSSLWRMPASKSARPRKLFAASEELNMPVLSRQGNRLAYVLPKWSVGIWCIDLGETSRTPRTPFKLVPSTRNDAEPEYSPDGNRIAFTSDRSGDFQIWVCNSDGSNAVQLTSLVNSATRGPRWSPDGQSIVFAAKTKADSDIYTIGANGGVPRRLTTDPASDRWPSWSRDGHSIYFGRSPDGIWKMPAAGGDALQVTGKGGLPQESPDGKYVYYMKAHPYPEQCSVWRMPTGGGEETKVLYSVHCDAYWGVREQGIYFFSKPDERGRADLSYYDFTSGKARRMATIERPPGWLAVSPDGRTLLYSPLDFGSDLMLVENFR